MFPSKHHKDDKDKGKGKDNGKDHKKGPRKNSFFSAADKSGLAFVRKRSKDGKDYEISVEKLKPRSESRKASRSGSRHDERDLPDIGRLAIEDDPDRYARHSRGGDSYGSYETYGSYRDGSHEYLTRNPQSPGRDSSRVSGSTRRYTNSQYPDPEDGDVFYSDEDEESQVPYRDQRSHPSRGSTSYQSGSSRSSRHAPESVFTGSGSVSTETLYERRHGGFRDAREDRYDDGSIAPRERDSISQRSSRASHISGSSQRTVRPGDGSRAGYDYDSDEDSYQAPPSRQSTSTRRSSQSRGYGQAYGSSPNYGQGSGRSSRYTDDTSGYSYASEANLQPPPPSHGSSRAGGSGSSRHAPSSRHSQTSMADSSYRPNPRAEVIEAEDRASLRSRNSASTAYEIPAPSTASGSRHHRAPATGYRAPPSGSGSRRESTYRPERFSGPDPFQYQVDPGSDSDIYPARTTTNSSTSRSSASRSTGSGFSPTARMFHYYEEGGRGSTTSGTSSRGTANRSRTGTSIPSDSDSDDTITAYRREGKRGSSHAGSGRQQQYQYRDEYGDRDGDGARSWIGSSQDTFTGFR
ncbi:hypothetical protein V8F20_009250 [Naviculisporaceae sp. PSN 640]